MKPESNIHARKLKSVITALSTLIRTKEWTAVSLVLVDAIEELEKLTVRNRELADEVEYWQRRSSGL